MTSQAVRPSIMPVQATSRFTFVQMLLPEFLSDAIFQNTLIALVAVALMNAFLVFSGFLFIASMFLEGIGLWASVALVTGLLFSGACLVIGLLISRFEETHSYNLRHQQS